MEKELKEYLRHYRNMSEDDIARIEETATEDQLEVLRKGMQFEVTASASVEQIRREQEETQKKA